MDLKLAFNGSFYDLARAGADLAAEVGLETAVIVSLFTDRRAGPDDVLPDGTSDRRGWWGDSYALADGDRIGSRLWLLSREKHLPAVAARVRQYAEEALAWMIEDNLAKAVRVETELQPSGRLALAVTIERPAGTPLTYKFTNLWEILHAV